MGATTRLAVFATQLQLALFATENSTYLPENAQLSHHEFEMCFRCYPIVGRVVQPPNEGVIIVHLQII